MIARRALAIGAVCGALAFALPAALGAQTAERAPLRTPVLVIDYEGLFNRSLFGRRVAAEIQAEGRALVEENDRIEAELTAEELLLTSQRDEMAPDAFRALADAFDDKVQRMRAEQDAKARAVGQGREAELRLFRELVTPIIASVMQETGALVVLDRTQAIVWAEALDVTGLVLEKADAAIGASPAAEGESANPNDP